MELYQVPIYSFPNEVASLLSKSFGAFVHCFVRFRVPRWRMVYLHCIQAFLRMLESSCANAPPLGLCLYGVFQAMVATCIELASLDYAAPSGFLNLLALSSTDALSVLFHTESALEILLSGVSLSQKPPQLSLRSAPRADTRNKLFLMLQGILQLKDPFFTKWFYPNFL
jgi:hypothetical protein